MVIAIFRSLEGENLEDYSIRLAERWRIGQKGLDNGVILLFFLRERKMRLEVGYGLEAVLPDAVAGQIISEVIAPRFRERRYAPGLEAAVKAMLERITAAKAKPTRPRVLRPPPEPPLWVRVLSSPVGFVLLVTVLFAVVIVLPMVLAAKLADRWGYTAGRGGWTRQSSWGSSSSSPGGSSGGGGFSSSGSSSGGFSGGGGAFGGGGASGSW